MRVLSFGHSTRCGEATSILLLEENGAWLQAAPRSVTTPIRYNAMPDTPDSVIVIADTGGFGLEVEDAFDNPTFQVRCRGPSALTTRDLAFRIDGFFLNQGGPFLVGLTYVLGFARYGGRPSYLTTDERGRTVYTANYTAKSKR